MIEKKDTTITFTTEDGDMALLHVLEQTKINGITYLLVVDDIEEEESEALILKEVSGEDAEEAVYDVVEEEKELTAISAIFEELLDDVELVTQD